MKTSQKYRTFNCCLALLATTLLFFGCDILDPEEESDKAFTAKFSEGYIDENEIAFIVLSDMDGNVIEYEFWNGNKNQYFQSTQESEIMVTLGVYRPYDNRVYMTSNIGVKPEEWTWKGIHGIEYQGEVNLEFTGYTGSSGWCTISGPYSHRINELPPAGSIRLPLYDSPADLLVVLCPDNHEQRQLWVRGVEQWETREVDISELGEPMLRKDVQFPFPMSEFQYTVDAFLEAGDYYSPPFWLPSSHNMYGEEVMSSMGTCYPKELNDFRTRLVSFSDSKRWEGDYLDSYQFGQIPQSIKFIDADAEIMKAAKGQLEVRLSGEIDSYETRWTSDMGTNTVYWTVYCDPETPSFSLPQMPEEIRTSFGLPTRDSYSASRLRLIEYPDLAGFDEVIHTLFKSEEYFFNIATRGVRARVKQIGSDDGTVGKATRESNNQYEFSPFPTQGEYRHSVNEP